MIRDSVRSQTKHDMTDDATRRYQALLAGHDATAEDCACSAAWGACKGCHWSPRVSCRARCNWLSVSTASASCPR
ncbi:hypothetical protein WR25_02328 [Diploscapter pachys]|uniref:Uncharacterized protein n=1 Tax=Diploscapter pachys TaxID=2018661 RepID=A0A2A2KFJ8_9BILA|nr:hypothetical protein WR25_02328 [Diploscapter pachys]